MAEKTSNEPAFIAQTFEREHVIDEFGRATWVHECVRAAGDVGASFSRLTWREDGTGLLFESWAEAPDDQGEPRWAFFA
ncbi:MAG: hypothetical protein ACPG4X_16540 [Pikeienuella sp.]